MTVEEAIEHKQQKVISLNEISRHKMRLYQTGVISKEQHNAEQSVINKDRLAEQLGIEAMKRLQSARELGHGGSVRANLLPGETEK